MRVFVSYRRDDAAGHAGRLHDDLTERLGPGSVFQDVVSLAPGDRFLPAIDEFIGRCDVVLAVIGRRWQEPDPRTGRPRLDDPNDVVRAELEAGLRRGLRLVPVLVDRAALPDPVDLPPTLRPLLEHNAIELRDEAWPVDLDRLCAALGVSREPARRLPPWLFPAVAVAIAVLAGVVTVLLHPFGAVDAPSTSQVAAPTAAPQPWPSEQAVTVAYSGDGTGRVTFTVQKWWQVPDAEGTDTVSVQVKVADATDVSLSVYPQLFRLLVDQVPQNDPVVGPLGAQDHPAPQQATLHLVVFSHVTPGRRLELLCGYDADHKAVVLRDG